MKKSLAVALVLVLFWVGNTSVASVHAQPGTPPWNVGPGQMFPTITAALTSGLVMPGDSIHVWNNPVPYLENNPVINIPNIKIIGQSVGGVTINPAGPGPFFVVLASGVTIMELTIWDTFMLPGDLGILILSPASGCKIINNVILSFDYGVVIDNSPNNEIIGNDISNCLITPGQPPMCSTGVYIIGPGATKNVVRGNELGWTAPNWFGVGTNGASGNTITFNNFWATINVPNAFVMPGDVNTWCDFNLQKGNFWNPIIPPPYIIDPLNIDFFESPGLAPYNWAAMPWDINRDCKCDIRDIATAAVAFGSKWSTPGWNPKADINGDYKIDIKDIASVAIMFGWTDP